MQSFLSDEELIAIAVDVAAKIREILGGTVACYDEGVQNWATAIELRIPSSAQQVHPLIDVIQDNLVNVLSCDNAPWDTTPSGFREGLERLEKAVAQREQAG